MRLEYRCEACGWTQPLRWPEDRHAVTVHEDRLCPVLHPEGDPYRRGGGAS